MWTDKNAKDVARLLKSFKPKNRFIVQEFGKHAEDRGKGKLFAKLQRSMVHKLAGWHALQMAAQQHVCLACKDKILPSASAVCSECLTTPKANVFQAKSFRVERVLLAWRSMACLTLCTQTPLSGSTRRL